MSILRKTESWIFSAPHLVPLHKVALLYPALPQTGIFQTHRIVVVQIINSYHLVASAKQMPAQVGADEACGSCNQYLHYFCPMQ